ncbi:MAG: RNase adapter RapZ [Rhodospirillales bacterium]|nr:RNase adapter RapZ [Rhodospirillales bacterium]
MNNAGATHRRRIILVTGMSGAGKSSALKALEDLNFEAVDNVPLSLLGALVSGSGQELALPDMGRSLAIGVDIRTRDFGVDALVEKLDQLISAGNADVRAVFIDCDDEELRRRYEETRHRHPLAIDRPVADGIAHERKFVSKLRDRADLTIDTTGLGPGELKRILDGHFGPENQSSLAVFVTSFSYRRGIPREADLVFDVRFLANPHYEADLKDLNGRDAAIGEFIERDEAYPAFFKNLTNLIEPLLPRYRAEGKSYLTVAVGCTGGRHRSVFVAEQLRLWFEGLDQAVRLHHRDLED